MLNDDFNIVKSVFRKFGIVASVVALILFSMLALGATVHLNWYDERYSLNRQEAWLYYFIIFSMLAGLVFFLWTLHKDCCRIEIERLNKTITSTSVINGATKQFYFQSLDGYVDMVQRSKSGEFRVIYLVEGKKYVMKLSSYFYGNLKELEEAIKGVKYLGRREYSFQRSIAIFLGKEIEP